MSNAVAVASLLNVTLVFPRFLYSKVWKDPSQFGDIYQEKHFIKIMKDEVDIVKELPPDLKSVDIEAVGSLITDADLVKEAKPTGYNRALLPLLLRNRVIHFLGFGHRLGFDPLPFELQASFSYGIAKAREVSIDPRRSSSSPSWSWL
ncbi:GDP-fucose protein O-fucosyltransferase [Parasponia andersonii]|uniref:O-fucosyltransferase family protein n=1 Tax=Parasponia andersonii TaxID=3476 RepID=A0A2P5AN13_PARAD|nr:GDP-fucose protein O-fucosyltransferase [Parasponia andersonii]